METIDRLAEGIAHDLNNILAPVSAGIDMLALSSRDAAAHPMLEVLSSSIRRGGELVRHILTFSRGTEGRRQRVQVTAVIRELTEFFRRVFPRSIEFVTSIAEDLWSIEGNSTHIDQVLANFASMHETPWRKGVFSHSGRAIISGTRRLPGPRTHGPGS